MQRVCIITFVLERVCAQRDIRRGSLPGAITLSEMGVYEWLPSSLSQRGCPGFSQDVVPRSIRLIRKWTWAMLTAAGQLQE